ncbi:MAG TPA: PilZ domain-containing protein [Acidimicrobiales bacterium]|nr:PilZ domain-containing protein [Acidimicrobiales bacterium]
MPDPTLADLLDDVVVLRDGRGHGARYVVDHVHDGTVICSYVFRGRHVPPTRWAVGDEVELGAPAERGWIVADGRVESERAEGSVTVRIERLQVVQRRQAYREELVVPLVLRAHPSDRGWRGRTENLSASGFAARVDGTPFEEGTELLVTLALPDGDDLTLACRKVAGDLPQRFELVGVDPVTEERLVRLVRITELARRRARDIRE